MIFETVFNALMSIPNMILFFMPSFNFTIPINIMANIGDVFYGIFYLLPIEQLKPLILFTIAEPIARFVFVIMWRIKSFIPTMGK